MTKRVKIIVLLITITIMLNACSYPPQYKWKISNQVNTQWISEDKKIVLSVNDNHLITGTMQINGEVIEIFVATEPQAGTGIHIYPINAMENEIISTENEYEYWICSYKSEKEFIATVRKTSFYNVGKEISFYRVDTLT